jgi:Xaa-Pro aminopeptidase
MDTRTSPIPVRLESMRDALRQIGADALLVPSSDPHLSEYLPERWQGRVWLSGFTGSMGTLVVTTEGAALFADSRYWVQAERELHGSGIDLVKIPTGAATHHIDWLTRQVRKGGTVVVDGSVLALAAGHALRRALEGAGVALRTDVDLFSAVWDDRPALPQARIYAHRAPHAATPRSAKLASVRQAMAQHKASHHFVSTVDDVAWITNLRGADVDYNPVFLAHLLIDAAGATLFVGTSKIDAALAAELAADGIALAGYDLAAASLAALPAGSTPAARSASRHVGVARTRARDVTVVESINPSTLAKSRKTPQEAEHIVREAMAEDGAAMCHFYAWFEAALARGERITEITVDEKLSAERASRAGFVGLSFPVIAGFNANGAMPHYRAHAGSEAVIEGDGLLLIDSGGQYLGGTTDITRVWPVGTVSPAMKRDYTLVLKGTMALSRTLFPRGTLSPMLDAIARAPLWAEGLDFGHGTGHGVGYFLNVHEGPQSISKAVPEPTMAMEPGMITSIEPGLYRAGQWGIRIENLVLNVPAITPEDGPQGNPFGEMLAFETLTLCPIDTRCLDQGPAARRRDRLAERLSRPGARAAVAAGQRPGAGLADRTDPGHLIGSPQGRPRRLEADAPLTRAQPRAGRGASHALSSADRPVKRAPSGPAAVAVARASAARIARPPASTLSIRGSASAGCRAAAMPTRAAPPRITDWAPLRSATRQASVSKVCAAPGSAASCAPVRSTISMCCRAPARPSDSARRSSIGRQRVPPVTIANRPCVAASRIAASASPITGPSKPSRSAHTPGSPKQPISTPSAPSPKAAKASSAACPAMQ